MKHVGVAVVVAVFGIGCSSTTIEQVGSSGGASGQTSSGAPSVGGGSTTGSGSTALVGTWDVQAAGTTMDQVAIITIDTTTLKIESDPLTLQASLADAAPTIAATWRGVDGAITTARDPSPLDLGQIPYGVGGRWILQGAQADRCNVTAAPAFASLDCSNLADPLNSTLQGVDFSTREPLMTGLSMAQRTATLDSVFGDMGGKWTVILPRGNCQVTIQGSTLDAQCTRTVRQNYDPIIEQGTLTLNFSDGFASGMSSLGEVSAKRR